MSKKQSITKNIKLSDEILSYIQDNPEVAKKFPSNATIVVTKSDNENLNNINKKVLKSLQEEGKPVIKAEKTNSNKNPWTFTPLSFT